jgi:hypothetical protein
MTGVSGDGCQRDQSSPHEAAGSDHAPRQCCRGLGRCRSKDGTPVLREAGKNDPHEEGGQGGKGSPAP